MRGAYFCYSKDSKNANTKNYFVNKAFKSRSSHRFWEVLYEKFQVARVPSFSRTSTVVSKKPSFNLICKYLHVAQVYKKANVRRMCTSISCSTLSLRGCCIWTRMRKISRYNFVRRILKYSRYSFFWIPTFLTFSKASAAPKLSSP